MYKILKFGVDRAYIERDTAIQKFTKKRQGPWLWKDVRTVCPAIHTSLKNKKSKDYCKADLKQRILFFITIFRLAIPAFFRFTEVTELM